MISFPILPDQVVFVLLSFEGPDTYSQAGGLGVRITCLARSIAAQVYQTHLFFVIDQNLPAYQRQERGNLHLHRWCQWISHYHPNGVYDGEKGKRNDYTTTIPPFIIEIIARPAAANKQHLIVLAEEWHISHALIQLSDQLHAVGLRCHSVWLWNANNTMGFHRIDWNRLSYLATLSTISRYMKQIMRFYGQDPLIISNGIPSDLDHPVPEQIVQQVRVTLCNDGEIVLMKVGWFDPAKCWWMAVEAAAKLKQSGQKVSSQ